MAEGQLGGRELLQQLSVRGRLCDVVAEVALAFLGNQMGQSCFLALVCRCQTHRLVEVSLRPAKHVQDLCEQLPYSCDAWDGRIRVVLARARHVFDHDQLVEIATNLSAKLAHLRLVVVRVHTKRVAGGVRHTLSGEVELIVPVVAIAVRGNVNGPVQGHDL